MSLTSLLQRSILTSCLLSSSLSLSATVLPELNKIPTPIEITDKEGGKVSDGSTWKSADMAGKPWVLFYVDPDESELNNHLTDAFKKEGFNDTYMQSVATINLAATWKPNSIIGLILSSKQKEFPETIYVEDEDRKLVKEWKLEDNTYVVIYFDKTGKVLLEKLVNSMTRKLKPLLKS